MVVGGGHLAILHTHSTILFGGGGLRPQPINKQDLKYIHRDY